ncbi:MAG TPA: aminotransferase class I/II-fold pyridoxal phosphate-dependent enzyme, partial [Solirubrobacteraceae bacterium]|nr:aminotransferase class I/II-fold pyridoxal phosphate-dependent enzyme [Solirubrobacteraceae bacterium]
GFASDNAATVHPQVLNAIAAANEGHAFGYGHDALTERVQAQFATEFGDWVQAFPVFNGSGANVVAIRAVCRPYAAVICTDTAHINVDECGAPEAIAGVKLLTVPHQDGKLTPEALERRIERVGDEHAVQPRLLSISQVTELGTVYTAEEITTLSRTAHEHHLRVHLDGARLANAAAALGLPLRALTTDAGVDIVSFGATKNGALAAEAVVVLDPELAGEMLFLRKQTLQLASKMRFIAAQLGALLTGELWRENAAHANTMAARLVAALDGAPGLEITRPVQANAVFARLPASARAALHERHDFYDWDEASGEVRWMCAWDTTEDDVDEFAAAVRAVL